MHDLTVLGDGLAGLMLANRLLRSGHQVRVHGDGRTNTPPVALVHLFAGRTFRRHPLEIDVFRRAIEHWQAEPLAREFRVQRCVAQGDRLDKSADDHDLPAAFAPIRVHSREWLEYGPGFSIATKMLEARLRQDLGQNFQLGRAEESSLSGTRVLCLGLAAQDRLPSLTWDISAGRLVEARTKRAGEPKQTRNSKQAAGLESLAKAHSSAALPHQAEAQAEAEAGGIFIGGGLHLAPHPLKTTVSLGGRFSPLSPSRHDELEKAQELTGIEYEELSSWTGQRCSPLVDHRPVLGWLDAETFAFFGFGSRALFWLPYCVEVAVEALTSGSPTSIPPELDVRRFSERPS